MTIDFLDPATIAAISGAVAAIGGAVTKGIKELVNVRKQLDGPIGEPTMRKLIEEVHAASRSNAVRLDVHAVSLARQSAAQLEHARRLAEIESNLPTIPPPEPKH